MEFQAEKFIMNTHLNKRKTTHSLFVISMIVALGLLVNINTADAEPYLAIKNNMKCSTCHVNPLGGGMRTSFGNIYGHTQLPKKVGDFSSAEMGKISDFLSLGGNLRYNAEHSSDDADNTSSTFRVDSAQLYLAITPKDTGLTFYLDQQVAPGAAVNREAYLQYNFLGQHYIKAGKMYSPFGLRIEDDNALVRQVSGFNFDSSDNGVELGLEFDQATVNFFITNGTSAVSNNDDNFQYGVRAEKIFSNFRIGSTAVLNTADDADRQLFNLYGGLHIGDFTFLGEIDWITTERATGSDQNQLVGLIEVNYQWMQGLNIKLTGEYFDPDNDIDENHENRLSLVAEYTPISNLQLRTGIRISEGIPQQPQRSNDKFFLQAHLYF
jgi:hypothetical protein